MPFKYRDNPKFSDRFWGKSGEEILNELKSDLDPERRMFFESPSWRQRQNNAGFRRGFPFADDRKRTNIRSYLDDIAARHPEFADQLREPPWDEDFCSTSPGRQARGGVDAERARNPGQEAGSSSCQNPGPGGSGSGGGGEPHQNLTNFGLRNTVPLGPEAAALREDRHQRSMSAPPDSRAPEKPAKRFVTKCEIPVMHDPTQESGGMKSEPETAQQQQQPQQQRMNNSPNVRVIPIQVEGRDAPLVNTNLDTSTNFGAEAFRDPAFDGRLPRDFGAYQRHSPRFGHKERPQTPPNQQYAHHYQQYIPPQQHFTPHQQPFGSPQQHQPHPQQQQQPPQSHPHYQQQQQQQQQHYPHPQFQGQNNPFGGQGHPQRSQTPQGQPTTQQFGPGKPSQPDETDSKPRPPPPQQQQQPPPKPEIKDPIERVHVIQKEVEELMRQVESFKGNSRSDKQYLMLDELLTRQMLLLDNIDTEGKENVRQARKDTIRSIQRCISTLENKVPLVEESESAGTDKGSSTEPADASGTAPQSMDVDKTKENTPVDGSQKMDVDEKTGKECQQTTGTSGQQQPTAAETKTV